MRTKILLKYLFGRPQDTVCKYNNKMDPTLIGWTRFRFLNARKNDVYLDVYL